MEKLHTPFATLELSRYPQPRRNKALLRAWDAADEYILNHLHEQYGTGITGRLLILNDSFGALSLSLSAYHPTLQTDSYLAVSGVEENARANQITPECIDVVDSLTPLEGAFDWVLMKLPKSHAMLEHQLHTLRGCVDEKTRFIAAAMAKNIHTNTLKLFERIIGPTSTSLAKKKARLVLACYDDNINPGESPYPKSYPLEGTNYTVLNHANVFSREGLDIGTRFFLQHLPREGDYESIIDLGCGNGVVGLMAGHHFPDARITFCDESYMAVASARANFRQAFGDSRDAAFVVDDALAKQADNSADLILNNPPFHQQHAVGTDVALRMFREAKRVLRPGGELWVIGNRHLGYHVSLKRLFGHCDLVVSNKKFTVLKANNHEY